MAEQSAFWDGTTLGDATIAPYSALEYATWLINILGRSGQAPAFQRSFIPMSAAGDLAVTGTATPVSIAAGEAFVAGYWYENTASTTLAVSTPGGNPRVDRVVLRINFAAQTIRLALLAGTTAAIPVPPALTQVFGTTWEVSLAQVYITTGGVITVRDERLGSMSMGPEVLFRDIRERTFEEFFDNFNLGSSGATTLSTAGLGWFPTFVSSGAATVNTGVPSSFNMTSGATANSTATVARGAGTGSAFYPTELAQAPLLLEWRATAANAAADAVTRIEARIISAAGTDAIIFGVVGPASTANLVLRLVKAAGPTTDFNTGVAIDTSGVYHTFGIWVPTSAGPVVALYDGVVVAAIGGATLVPASTVDMRVEFVVGNGATATARAMNIDWVRLVRGA